MSATGASRARGWRLFRRSRAEADDRPAGDTRCRNCGAEAPSAYCPSCGQETRLKLPRATQFVREAAGRYVAFDGKMWRSLALLMVRPGHLTREYLAGRRVRYVRPARLVLVLAIVLFAVIRLMNDDEGILHVIDSASTAPTPPAVPQSSPPAKSASRTSASPPSAAPAKPKGDAMIELDGEPLKIGAGPATLEIDDDLDINATGMLAPIGKRFTSFNRLDRSEKVRAIVAGMLRFGPYALIVLLPAFALLMQLLYLGRSRRYPERPRRYAEHLVYGAHLHAFAALVGTIAVLVSRGPVSALLVAWAFVYLPWSMHAVYGGRKLGAVLRASVAAMVYVVMFALAVAGLFVVAVLFR